MARLRHASAVAGLSASALMHSVVALSAPAQGDAPPSSFAVDISVDAARTQGPLSRAWSYFGADEPNYATMKDGEDLLASLGALNPGHVYFRAHHLLTSGDGTPARKWGSTNIYSEDANGNPIYNYAIIDHIFDTYLKHGLKPYVEIGFMPQALSSDPEPYRSDWRPGLDYGRIGNGVSYPPRDYGKWGELVFRWITHCLERYDRSEVASFPRLVDLARRDHVRLESVLTWAFEFEDQPYFAGYRQLMSNGLDLPVLNVSAPETVRVANKQANRRSGQDILGTLP